MTKESLTAKEGHSRTRWATATLPHMLFGNLIWIGSQHLLLKAHFTAVVNCTVEFQIDTSSIINHKVRECARQPSWLAPFDFPLKAARRMQNRWLRSAWHFARLPLFFFFFFSVNALPGSSFRQPLQAKKSMYLSESAVEHDLDGKTPHLALLTLSKSPQYIGKITFALGLRLFRLPSQNWDSCLFVTEPS